jgi:histidine triad (HIT) family protein
MSECIFCKIIKGEIPCAKILEDERVLCFVDINPINPGHALVIPKTHYHTLFDMDPADLHACILAAQKVGKAVYRGVSAEGLNLVQNNYRAAGQLIDHAHFHLIPRHERDGFLTSWPGRPYPPGGLETHLKKIVDALD